MSPSAGGNLRRVLLVAIASSCLVIIDSSAVSLALPAIQRELGGGLVLQQWVVDGYLLTLGALILAAGALADRFGTARLLAVGTLWFTVTSVVCGLAPAGWVLVLGRLTQGAAGAVITPSALALITAAATGATRARLIGQWTAWIAAASVAAPFFGGAAVDLGSWRLVFLINIVPAALMWRPLARLRREARPPAPVKEPFDVLSAVLTACGLGGIVLSLITQSSLGWTHPLVAIPLIGGVLLMALYVLRQRRSAAPQLPLGLFRSRAFAAGNGATLWAYGALGMGGFLVGLYLQQRMGLTAFEAGIGMLPATIPMLLLSSSMSRLMIRTGPRLPMALGPAVAGAGYTWLAFAVPPLAYWRDVFGPMVLLGLGLAIMVAPLTATVLSAVPPGSEGVGSAVNNAVARIASLVAIGAAGAIMGGVLDDGGFRRGVSATAILFAAAAVTSAVWIPTARIVAPPAGDGEPSEARRGVHDE
ncbi:MFS transporter [Sinomonas sp. P10A9]|uniref:MFS transporter n=1 Tax=Sinomonas puerhi TaxID=3238584 RepID=A0AB39L0W9_9MICC